MTKRPDICTRADPLLHEITELFLAERHRVCMQSAVLAVVFERSRRSDIGTFHASPFFQPQAVQGIRNDNMSQVDTQAANLR